MHMPRMQFSVRSTMVAVAIVALCIWVNLEVEARRIYYDWLVQHYYYERMVAIDVANSGPGGAIREERIKADAVRRAKASAYYTALIQKYEHAARYPWLPVTRDPPKPKGIDDNQIVVK
jgi:hypothetical protein